MNRADATITYRRGVLRRLGGMFAGRGIALPGLLTSAAILLAALVLGIGAGWLTAHLPQMLAADAQATASASPSPTPDMPLATSLPVLSPITRTLDQGDRDAGVITTDIAMRGEGTFTPVAGVGTPLPTGADVRWVSVAVEDGVRADAGAFKNYVMAVLNDNRAWGSGGAVQYVPTDGVADYRVILVSPYTFAAMCPDAHMSIDSGPVVPVSPSPSPDASHAQGSPTPPAMPPGIDTHGYLDDAGANVCADDGIVMISVYDWTAGTPAFADDVRSAREYLVLHRFGHLAGKPDVDCAGGRADVMVDQAGDLPEGCEANPWPFPDAPSDVSPDPSSEPSPPPAAAPH